MEGYPLTDWIVQNASFNATSPSKYPSIATDTSDDVYIAYQTHGYIPGHTISSGNSDIVVCRLNSNSSTKWVFQSSSIKTTGNDAHPSIAVFGHTVYVVYETTGYLTDVSSANGIVFVTFDISSNTPSAIQYTPVGIDTAPKITVDTTGNLYGIFQTTGNTTGPYVFYIPATGGYFSSQVGEAGTSPSISTLNGHTVITYVTPSHIRVATVSFTGSALIIGAANNVVSLTSIPTITQDTYNNVYIAFQSGTQVIVYQLNVSLSFVAQATSALFNTTKTNFNPNLATTGSNIYLVYQTMGSLPGINATGMTDIVIVKFNTNLDVNYARQLSSFNTTGYDEYPAIAVISQPGADTYIYGTYDTYGTVTGGMSPSSGSTNIAVFQAHETTLPGQPIIAPTSGVDSSVPVMVIGFVGGSGSLPILNYTVIASLSGQPIKTITGQTSLIHVPNLINGTTYDFTATATNAVGTSVVSAPASATPYTVPDAPFIIFNSLSGNTLTITFSTPYNGGSPYPLTPASFTAYCGVSQELTSQTTIDSGTATMLITNLIYGSAYGVYVVATNLAGSSAASNVIDVTPLSPPNQPSFISIIGNGDNLDITFTYESTPGAAPVSQYSLYDSTLGLTFIPASSPPISVSLPGATAGTTYELTLTALSEGYGSSTPAMQDYTYVAPPSTPNNPDAISDSPSTAIVSWSPPSAFHLDNNITYTITAFPSSPDGTLTYTPAPPDHEGENITHSVTFQQLTNGTTYYFTIIATNGAGSSSAAYTNYVMPKNVPSPPVNVNLLQTNIYDDSGAIVDISLQFSWGAPLTDNGSRILSYTFTIYNDISLSVPLYSATQSHTQTSFETTLTQLELPVQSLQYVYTVYASNAIGNGPSSHSASIAAAPFASLITDNSGQYPLMSTTAIATIIAGNTGGAAITEYSIRLFQQNTDTLDVTLIQTADISVNALSAYVVPDVSYTFTDISYGYNYYVDVIAVNGVGDSLTGTSPTAYASRAPDPPVITNVGANDSQAFISWGPPVFDGGYPVIGYDIVTDPFTSYQFTGANQSWIIITGLQNGTIYSVSVRAINADGSGNAAVSESVMPIGYPSAPIITQVDIVSSSQLSISWDPPVTDGGIPILSYLVNISGGAEQSQTVSADIFTYTFGSLVAGIPYYVSVAAKNRVGYGPADSSGSFVTAGLPSAPTIINPVTVTPGFYIVSWTPPVYAGRPETPLTGYYVYTYNAPPPNGSLVSIATAPPTPPYSLYINDVIFGKTYYAQVSAFNADGEGDVSEPSQVFTIGQPPAMPGTAPPVITNNMATVFWTPPLDPPNNPPVQLYTIYVYSADGILVQTPYTIAAPQKSLQLSGLSYTVPYLIQVSATNILGEGPQNGPVEVVIPSPSLCANGVGVLPLAPGLLSPNINLGIVTVRWTPPAVPVGSSQLIYYKVYVYYSDMTLERSPSVVAVPAAALQLAGLSQGVTYLIQVSAVNLIGEGPANGPIIITIPVTG